MSSATMLSRVLGLVRDIVTAAYFGAGGSVDAFFVAFRLPNTLRRLFAEGSLTVAFVPVFVETLENEGPERANEVGRRTFSLLGVVLAAVTLLGITAAPWVVRMTAWGFARDPDKFALTVDLTRQVFPFIAMIGLTALAGGMLNGMGIFSYPALAPVVLNLSMVIAVLGLAGLLDVPVQSLVYGVIAGGALQFALQWWPLRRSGFQYYWDGHWKDPAIRRVLTLMGPTVFGVAVYQVNIVVSTLLASWLPDGSVSYLYYAERLFQLPLGVFAVSVGTASLPSLSRLAARGDESAFRGTLDAALRMTWFIVLPAAVGLVVLATPILAVLLQRGAFDAAMVRATAQALVWYAAALIPVAWVRVLAPAFYALKDTRTPVWAAFWALWVNLGVSLVLMGPMKHAGLALATACSSAFNAAYLALYLRRRLGGVSLAGTSRNLGLTVVASAAMGIAVWFGARWLPDGGGCWATAGLLLLVFGGGALYLVLARMLGLADAARLLGVLRRRFGGA